MTRYDLSPRNVGSENFLRITHDVMLYISTLYKKEGEPSVALRHGWLTPLHESQASARVVNAVDCSPVCDGSKTARTLVCNVVRNFFNTAPRILGFDSVDDMAYTLYDYLTGYGTYVYRYSCDDIGSRLCHEGKDYYTVQLFKGDTIYPLSGFNVNNSCSGLPPQYVYIAYKPLVRLYSLIFFLMGRLYENPSSNVIYMSQRGMHNVSYYMSFHMVMPYGAFKGYLVNDDVYMSFPVVKSLSLPACAGSLQWDRVLDSHYAYYMDTVRSIVSQGHYDKGDDIVRACDTLMSAVMSFYRGLDPLIKDSHTVYKNADGRYDYRTGGNFFLEWYLMLHDFVTPAFPVHHTWVLPCHKVYPAHGIELYSGVTPMKCVQLMARMVDMYGVSAVCDVVEYMVEHNYNPITGERLHNTVDTPLSRRRYDFIATHDDVTQGRYTSCDFPTRYARMWQYLLGQYVHDSHMSRRVMSRASTIIHRYNNDNNTIGWLHDDTTQSHSI